jgi:hypothetical protein
MSVAEIGFDGPMRTVVARPEAGFIAGVLGLIVVVGEAAADVGAARGTDARGTDAPETDGGAAGVAAGAADDAAPGASGVGTN